MNLTEYDISNPVTTTVLSSERITPAHTAEVRHITLAVPEDGLDFVEGQSIGVLAPGPHEFGNPFHLRLYSIASTQSAQAISICVRRCFYVDEVSGESYPGKASNFLCDARPGDKVQITGPYGAHFSVPSDDTSNLLMVGVGTGIAPFRAFVRHIYEDRGGWQGKVRLFYGARTGLELLYRNDPESDLSLFYDRATFQAFEAVSPRPHFDVPPEIDKVLIAHSTEVWEMVKDPKTYIFLAGLEQAAEQFEAAMVHISGSEEEWRKVRSEIASRDHYAELLY
ncbi:MAG: FAD-binding oxidoreductase [Bryobacteraceae bacterium]